MIHTKDLYLCTHKKHVANLLQVLENLTKEKQSVKDHYDQLLQEDRIAAEEKEFKLKKEYAGESQRSEKKLTR